MVDKEGSTVKGFYAMGNGLYGLSREVFSAPEGVGNTWRVLCIKWEKATL